MKQETKNKMQDSKNKIYKNQKVTYQKLKQKIINK